MEGSEKEVGEERAEAAATGKPVANKAGTRRNKGICKINVQMKSGDQTL